MIAFIQKHIVLLSMVFLLVSLAYRWYVDTNNITDQTLTEYQNDQKIFDTEKQEATDRAVALDKTLRPGRLEKLAQQRPSMVRGIVSRASDNVFLRLACPSISATMLSSISANRDDAPTIGSDSVGDCTDY